MCLINIQPFLQNMLWLYGNYNAQRTFKIIFFLCWPCFPSELPQNPFQSLYYHYLTYLTANYSCKCMKIVIIKEISICAWHFQETWCRVARPLPKIQVNIKIQVNTARVPDYLSVSFNYEKTKMQIASFKNDKKFWN